MPELLDCTPEIQAILHTAINQATDNRLRDHIMLQSMVYRQYLERMDPILERKAAYYLALTEKDQFAMNADALARHRKQLASLEEEVLVMDCLRTALDDIDRLYRAQCSTWARFMLERRREYEHLVKAYMTLEYAQNVDLACIRDYLQMLMEKQNEINLLKSKLAAQCQLKPE